MIRKLLITSSLLVLSALAGHASAAVRGAEEGFSPVSSDVCYSQVGPKYSYAVSQDFADFTAETSQAADDFTLTSACTIERVTVEGKYFRGYGPAASVAIAIYTGGGWKPGSIVEGGNEPSNRYSDPSQDGNLSIKLKHPLTLPAGKYWISVAVNMAYRAGGEWGWWTTPKKIGSWAVWQNPNNGFGTGCKTYSNIRKCLGDLGPSMIFTISS